LNALRAAPQCEASTRACPGVGSSANRYARSTTYTAAASAPAFAAMTARNARSRAPRRPYKRAHIKAAPPAADTSTTIVPAAVCRTGTGSNPPRHQRHTV
jgi:hypothetical protein